MLARDLEVPVYPFCEHLLQLGLSEVIIIMENESLKEGLCRHLVQSHLLVPATQLEPPSKGALRARSVINLRLMLESLAGSPEALTELIKRMIQEAASIGSLEKQNKDNLRKIE
jgi:hypothetical protein